MAADSAALSISLWLPFIGSLLGASVPAILAALVYPMQRRADRTESLHIEKRNAYREYLEKVSALALETRVAQHGDEPVLRRETYQSFSVADSMLRLYGPDAIIVSAEKLADLALNPEAVRGGDFMAVRHQLTELMRQDLFVTRVEVKAK